jgi:hypothetical protein
VSHGSRWLAKQIPLNIGYCQVWHDFPLPPSLTNFPWCANMLSNTSSWFVKQIPLDLGYAFCGSSMPGLVSFDLSDRGRSRLRVGHVLRKSRWMLTVPAGPVAEMDTYTVITALDALGWAGKVLRKKARRGKDYEDFCATSENPVRKWYISGMCITPSVGGPARGFRRLRFKPMKVGRCVTVTVCACARSRVKDGLCWVGRAVCETFRSQDQTCRGSHDCVSLASFRFYPLHHPAPPLGAHA